MRGSTRPTPSIIGRLESQRRALYYRGLGQSGVVGVVASAAAWRSATSRPLYAPHGIVVAVEAAFRLEPPPLGSHSGVVPTLQPRCCPATGERPTGRPGEGGGLPERLPSSR